VPSNYIFRITLIVLIALTVLIALAKSYSHTVLIIRGKPHPHTHWAYRQSRWNLWRYNGLHMSRIHIWSKSFKKPPL